MKRRLPVYWDYDYSHLLGYADVQDENVHIVITNSVAVAALSQDNVKGLSIGATRITPMPLVTRVDSSPAFPLKST